MNKLIHGEALDIMQKLIDRGVKVDAIICDPPYGVTNNSKDKEINIEKMFKILEKFNCPIILFGQDTAKNKYASKLKISSNHYKYSWYWNKKLATGFLNAKRQPLRVIEEILIFYEGQSKYNPQMEKGKPNHSKGTKHLKQEHQNNNYGNFKSVESDLGDLKYPKQILEFQKPHPSKAVHPTQKPVELMEYLVKTYTNEKDVVLDFTMGSGSTGVACKNLNRHFIGIELDEKYYNIAKERIGE